MAKLSNIFTCTDLLMSCTKCFKACCKAAKYLGQVAAPCIVTLLVCKACNAVLQRQKVQHKGKQTEQIDCVCGVTQATPGAEQYDGLWLQCDDCLSWLHGACVGYPKRAPKGMFLPAACTAVIC